MRDLLLVIAFFCSIFTASAQTDTFRYAYGKFTTVTKRADASTCRHACFAMELATKELCDSALLRVVEYHDAAAEIVELLYSEAMQALISEDSEVIINNIGKVSELKQLYGVFLSRRENLKAVIKINKYNKAKWDSGLRYRFEYRDAFKKAAEDHKIISL